MRRRRPPAEATAPVPDPQYVEDWVDPTEPLPVVDEFVPSWRADALPGEPAEAVPWRVLAEERVDTARRAGTQPEVTTAVDPSAVVATRGELPPEALQPPASDALSGPFGARCLWRDVEAFLAKIP